MQYRPNIQCKSEAAVSTNPHNRTYALSDNFEFLFVLWTFQWWKIQCPVYLGPSTAAIIGCTGGLQGPYEIKIAVLNTGYGDICITYLEAELTISQLSFSSPKFGLVIKFGFGEANAGTSSSILHCAPPPLFFYLTTQTI